MAVITAISTIPPQDACKLLNGTHLVEVHCEYQPEHIKSGDFMRVDFDVHSADVDGLYAIEVDYPECTWSGLCRFARVPTSPTKLQVKDRDDWVDMSMERLAQTRVIGLVSTVYRAYEA